MRVLVLDNTRATSTNPKTGGYVQKIGRCIKAAGFEVEYLLPGSARPGVLGKLRRYLGFYLNILRFDFSAFDLLYVNHYPYLAAPLLLRSRAIPAMAVHWHGEDLLPASRIKALLFAPLIGLLPSRARHFVPSEYFKGQLEKRIPSAHVTVSPSGGVDTQMFALRPEGGKHIPVRLGFASGLSKGKGLAELNFLVRNIHRLEQASDINIEIHYIDYGPGSLTATPENTTGGDKLVRWGTLSPDRMPDFYHAIDVLLFPIRRNAESLGLVALEAMACGLPVVAANKCACPEFVVPGQSGELFDPENPEDMMQKLATCIRRLSTYRPREMIEKRYASERVIRQYQDVLPGIPHT